MLVIVTYDISVCDNAGKKRLRQIAKICQNYGQRVQNSVFECQVDTVQLLEMKQKILEFYDETKDSIRFYNLGKKYELKISHYGIKPVLDLDEDAIIF